MKKIASHVRNFLPLLTKRILVETSPASFDIITSKKVILREMEYSRSSGTVVGIYSPLLGKGMFLVGVNNIISDDETHIIVFHSHDMSGIELSRQVLTIDEIASIVPFNNHYASPVEAIMAETSEKRSLKNFQPFHLVRE